MIPLTKFRGAYSPTGLLFAVSQTQQEGKSSGLLDESKNSGTSTRYLVGGSLGVGLINLGLNLVRFEEDRKSDSRYTSTSGKTQTNNSYSGKYDYQNIRAGVGLYVSPTVRLAATYVPRSITWYNDRNRRTEINLVDNTSTYKESVDHESGGDEEEIAVGAQIKPSSKLRINPGVLRQVPHTETKLFDDSTSPEKHSTVGQTKTSIGVEYTAASGLTPIGSLAMTSLPEGKMQEVAAGLDSRFGGIMLGVTGRYMKYDADLESSTTLRLTRWTGVFSLGSSF